MCTVFWWTTWLLWRIRLRTNNLLRIFATKPFIRFIHFLRYKSCYCCKYAFILSLQLPCIIWLILKKPKRFGLSWTINWVCMLLSFINNNDPYIVIFLLFTNNFCIFLVWSVLHCSRSSFDDPSPNWWPQNHHCQRQDLQVLLLDLSC